MEWIKSKDIFGNVCYAAEGRNKTLYSIARNVGESYWRWTTDYWLTQKAERTLKDAKMICEFRNDKSLP